MITKEDVAKMLVEFYREYKDHMSISIYYDFEEKKLVDVIDNDESSFIVTGKQIGRAHV